MHNDIIMLVLSLCNNNLWQTTCALATKQIACFVYLSPMCTLLNQILFCKWHVCKDVQYSTVLYRLWDQYYLNMPFVDHFCPKKYNFGPKIPFYWLFLSINTPSGNTYLLNDDFGWKHILSGTKPPSKHTLIAPSKHAMFLWQCISQISWY